MENSDFLKEKQKIREKMLRYSRAIKEGKDPYELDLSLSSDEILKKRIKKHKKSFDESFEESNSKANIYLKEDLINVKLEEKKSFGSRFLAKFKRFKNKNAKAQKELEKKLQSTPQSAPKQENTELRSSKELLQARNIKNKALNAKTKDLGKILSQAQATQNEVVKQKQEQRQERQQKDTTPQKSTLNTQKTPPPKAPPENKPSKALQNKEILKIKPDEARPNEEAKNTLLTGHTQAIKEERNLSFLNLFLAYLIVLFACLVFVPEIYIRSQIYYLSREIATLRAQENVLDEENKELKKNLESMRFQNQILDYLD